MLEFISNSYFAMCRLPIFLKEVVKYLFIEIFGKVLFYDKLTMSEHDENFNKLFTVTDTQLTEIPYNISHLVGFTIIHHSGNMWKPNDALIKNITVNFKIQGYYFIFLEHDTIHLYLKKKDFIKLKLKI